MGRKKKVEAPENHERWLVSYADFITLLFATFTALFAISNADKEKFAALAASTAKAFKNDEHSFSSSSVSIQGIGEPGSNVIITISPDTISPPSAGGHGASAAPGNESEHESWDDPLSTREIFEKANALAEEQEEEASWDDPVGTNQAAPTPTPAGSFWSNTEEGAPSGTVVAAGEAAGAAAAAGQANETGEGTVAGGTGMGTGGEGAGDAKLVEELQELLNEAGLDKLVNVRQESRGAVISLGEAAFFPLGEVQIMPQSEYHLDRIVNALRVKQFEIRIEGHTDNTPITSRRYRSNLELSALRAARVADYMIEEFHYPPDLISSSGYGEFRPVAENSTPDGRQQNRRVDIVILNEASRLLEPHESPSH